MTVDFRTYYKNGLIFYVTNEEQTEFVSVTLNDTRIVLTYSDKGKVPRNVFSQSNLNDGKWHSVRHFIYSQIR